MEKQTRLRTTQITETRNLSFPVGSIIAAEYLFAKLGLWDVFAKHKKRGFPIERLVWSLVSYKLSENQSISKAGDWINVPELLQIFSLEKFDVKAFYRTLATIGKNREEIISDVQDALFLTYDFKRTDVILTGRASSSTGKRALLESTASARPTGPTRSNSPSGSLSFRLR